MLKSCPAWVVAGIALAVAPVICPAPAWASAPGGFPYIVDRVPEEWLPQSSVIAITQTHDGYLWLGTLNGLVRFDGMQCTVFTEANTPGLKSSQIIYLAEDSRSNLWVGTETAGIAVIGRDGSVRNLDLGAGSGPPRLASVSEDAAGSVWLNTLDGQVVRYQSNRLEVLNGRARPVVAEKSGPLWFGMGKGLVTMRAVSNSSAFFWEQEYPVRKLDFLFAGKTNGCWRFADGRIEKWVNGKLERDWGAYPWGESRINAACEDNEGNPVVGTQDKGVFWYDSKGQPVQISGKNGLSHDTVLSLCVDREGDLWVGTDGGGLNRVRPRQFQIQEDSQGRTIQSVCEDGSGGYWYANFGGNLAHWSGGELKQYDIRQNGQNPYARSVFVDARHTVWVGTTLAGIFVWKGDSFQQVPGSEAGGSVSAIFEDREGRLWFGAQRGLLCLNGSAWTAFTTRHGLSADDIRALAEDQQGTLWIGTEGGGLDYLRNGRFGAVHSNRGLPSESITSLLVDRDNRLWIGTRAGLARLQENPVTGYWGQELLTGNTIGYLIEDDQGYLWIGSNAGLIRVSKQALNDLAAGNNTNSIPCRVYGKEDGLPTRECTQGSQPAACGTPDGILYFSTIKGLVSANPREFKPNPHPPPVVIESVLVDNAEQNTNSLCSGWLRSVTVPPGREVLEIRFTSLNLAARDRAQFRYRMEGHETAWTDDSRGEAHFSNLPPGRYRFHVIAANEDGLWNETGASMAIIVLPPFWRTWWFLGLNSALVLAGVILGVRYISTQKLQRQLATLRQREALEKERARIARDLHDQLGANLTQVAILGEMAAGDKNLPDEVESHAQQISQTARETTGALDEIVWAVNPSNDTLEGLITYACKYAQDYFAIAGLRYRLEVPTQLPHVDIPPELRHNVFLAFKEAVNNVVKHAQATEAWVRLILDQHHFAIELQDNGHGTGVIEEKAGRNGLRNMRKRMEDVGGGFSIGPSPGGGTLVRLTVPMSPH